MIHVVAVVNSNTIAYFLHFRLVAKMPNLPLLKISNALCAEVHVVDTLLIQCNIKGLLIKMFRGEIPVEESEKARSHGNGLYPIEPRTPSWLVQSVLCH